MDIVHWLVFQLFPMLGWVLLVTGFFIFIVGFGIYRKWLDVWPGIATMAFGLWLRDIRNYTTHAGHGIINGINNLPLINLFSHIQNHWVIWGIIPAVALSLFSFFSSAFSQNKWVPVLITIILGCSLTIGWLWMYHYYPLYQDSIVSPTEASYRF
ncbi:hypothetical protein ACJU26_09135 [Acidithiobacillus sp. M4-SHS-6]|uniref:hypothetical protein n=1 Tax=Acidithiobacillus sp. M4-SHS-6 TaxID=3383024 RepID=UPI0039BE35DA